MNISPETSATEKVAIKPTEEQAAPPPAQLDDAALIRWITALPKRDQWTLNALLAITSRNNPEFYRVYSDAKRREHGMFMGCGLTVLTIGGSVVAAATNMPLLIVLALLGTGAACAGATFAVITGKTVSSTDFSNIINSIRK